MVGALSNIGIHTVNIDFQVTQRITSLNSQPDGVAHPDAAVFHRVAGHGNAFNQITGFISCAPDTQLTELQQVLYGAG